MTSSKPFEQVRDDLERQLGRFDPRAYQALQGGEEAGQVRAKLEAAAGSSGLVLFTRHDHGSLLRLVGQERKALQYLVGNPLLAIQMTQHAIGASLHAPLRVLLFEDEDGTTCLEFDRPSSIFARFGDERIDQVAASLDRKLEGLAAAAMH